MWDPWAEVRATEDLRARLKWFLLGRVAVISCFLGMVAAAYLGTGQERYVVPVNRLLLVIIITYVFSMVSAIVLRRVEQLSKFTHIQVAFDVLLITGVIYLTGGLESPFPFLYSLPIINGAVLLFSAGALITAVLSAVAYDALIVALVFNLISPSSELLAVDLDGRAIVRLVTTNITFFLIAYLAGILTRRLHAMERLLEERQAERDRLAVLQETLARTIGSALITTDVDGRVTSIDHTAEQLTHQSSADLRGRDIGTIFPPLQLTPTARLQFLQSTAALEPVEFSHQLNGEPPTYFRCVAAPLHDTFGHPIGALYVLQDVTTLQQLTTDEGAAAQVEELCRESLEAATEMAESSDGLYGISEAMRRVRQLIERVADSDATVLLTGESGTGKELVARAIHARSSRRDKPFVAINCGAIPENLIESELFGHVRGAFTGAVADRVGCFRAANNGTIFLDEIGELPLHLQVKMLRVLQERVFRPVGSETNVAVNVRIIAATNRDLQAQVEAGRFRTDLFYRLNVITIDLPALRERREDIPLLVRHFLRQFSDLHGRRVNRFSVGAGRALLQYDYPGNVRELENVVEHAVALCEGDTAGEEHLPPYMLGNREPRSEPAPERPRPSPSWLPSQPARESKEVVDLDRDLAEYEKAVLLSALERAGGVKKVAARLLNINYRSLRHRLQKYGIGGELGDEPASESSDC